jgi:hypothetical protein
MFPVGKGGPVRKADNLTTFMPIILKSGSLNLQEPSGPVQACTGIILPLHFLEIAFGCPVLSEKLID